MSRPLMKQKKSAGIVPALFFCFRIIKHVTISAVIFRGYLNFAGANF